MLDREAANGRQQPSVRTPKGNPRCGDCGGTGIVGTRGAYHVCRCVSGTQAERDSQRRLNSIGTEYVPMRERLARMDAERKQRTQEHE